MVMAALVAASAVGGLVAAGTAHAAPPPVGMGRLGLCVGEVPQTSDEVIAEGPTYIQPFTLTVADGKTAACRAFDVAEGQYWITGGKYPQVPCDPAEHRGALGSHTCLGKVHHFHVTHRQFADNELPKAGPYTTGVGADSTIEQDAVLVYVRPGEFTEVRFHVVDRGTYPECIPNDTRSCS
jgi:hypothetical protein